MPDELSNIYQRKMKFYFEMSLFLSCHYNYYYDFGYNYQAINEIGMATM